MQTSLTCGKPIDLNVPVTGEIVLNNHFANIYFDPNFDPHKLQSADIPPTSRWKW